MLTSKSFAESPPPEVARHVAEADRTEAERFTLAQRQRLPRNRERQRLLNAAIALRDAGRLADAAATIEELLLQPDDCFVARRSEPASSIATLSTDRDGFPVLPMAISLRDAIRDLLGDSPELLTELRSRNRHQSGLSRSALDRLLPRGIDAQTEHATSLLMAGRCLHAASVCETLLRTPQLEARQRRRIDAIRAAARNHLDRPLIRTAATDVDPTGTAQNTQEPRTALDEIGVLPWPKWRLDLTRSCDAEAVAEWSDEQTEAQSSLAGPQNCVIMRSLAITAARDRIVAADIATGRIAWTIPRTVVEPAKPLRSAVRQFEQDNIHNGVETRLSAHGSTLYFLDRYRKDEHDDAPPAFTLNAYEVTGSGPRRLWQRTIGDIVHCPPVWTPDGLMLIANRATELCVVCLNGDGSIRYEQPIAIEEIRPSELPRGGFGLEPVSAGELLICPTRLGVTVAIETASGSLRWIDFDPSCLPSQTDRPLPAIRRLKGLPAYPSPLLVADERVYLLPQESDYIHCLDLYTGEALWRQPRRGMMCLVAATDSLLVATGDRTATALNRRTGQQRWERRIATPSGRGLCVDGRLVVPQPCGRLVRIELGSGTIVSRGVCDRVLPCSERMASDCARRPGNLFAYDGGVLVRSQTHLALHRLASDSHDLLTTPIAALSEDERLDRSRILMLTGATTHAIDTLNFPVSRERKEDWLHLSRECLFAQLGEAAVDDEEAIASLRPLLETPSQNSRLLLHQFRTELASGRYRVAERFAAKLSSRDESALIADGALLQSPAIAAAEQVAATSLNANALRNIADRMRERDHGDAAGFLAVFGFDRDAASIWGEVGDAQVESGNLQAAELCYLMLCESPKASDAARGLIALASMYEAEGRIRASAECWRTLNRDYRAVAVRGLNPGEWIESEAVGEPVRRELKQFRSLAQTLAGTTITVESGVSAPWVSWYDDDRRKVRMPPRAGFDALNHEHDGLATLTLVDRSVPRKLATIDVPNQFWTPPGARHKQAGHVLPLGASEPVAVSLLDGRPMWQRDDLFESRRRPKIIYCGPQLTVFQDRHHLVAVRTLDGSLAWRRDDLDRRSGLQANEVAGVIADESRLLLFDPDGVGYTEFSTRFGRKLGRGHLESRGVTTKRPPIATGRKVFYFVKVGDAWHARVRDLDAPGKLVIDEPMRSRSYFDRVDEDRVAFVSAAGELVIVNHGEGVEEIRCPLSVDWSRIHSLSTYCNESHVFVNATSVDSAASAINTLSSSDIQIPSHMIEGQFIAIDRRTKSVAWDEDFGKTTLIDTLHTRLPVLLLASRVRDLSAPGQNRIILRAVDIATGRIVEQCDTIPRSQILRWDYDAHRRQVTLDAESLRVRVSLGGPTYPASVERSEQAPVSGTR